MFVKSALVALGGATLAAAVTPLEVQGSQFVNSKTGDAFQIVGMAYQIGGSAGYDPSHGKDPLSNGAICKRDAALMQNLGVNTIRVYNLDPNLNHDECASVFNAAGMYMIIDVNSPLAGESLNSGAPWESYYAGYLNRTFAIVESFKSYPNTLGFFSGNEVINDVKTGATVPPYVRAVTRDLKNYIKNHADRAIPVGYSAADVRDVLEDTWNYFQCAIDGDANDMSRSDMFALNSYSWCGESTFQESGYDQLVALFKSTSVPVFYSEFGCNTPSPRVFTEIGTIYGDQMTGVFSGGVVYEYAQEKNNYGLAQCNDDGTVELLSDFATLQSQYKKVDFTKVQAVKAVNSKVSAPVCKSSLIKEKGFSNNFTLPAVPPGAQTIIDNGVSPKPSGKIVSISDYSVTQSVKDANGKAVSNLAVKPLADDASNTPGTTSSSTSSSSSSGSSTSGNAAPTLSPQGAASAAAMIIPAVVALCFTAGFTLI
ncbi:glycoside hydrolase family 72 protein [Annulohypoxylon maeteangense]|uniref:glycoside hydrolase family 72 protein n=1 Tax=Annulohypoxylon maeteangense TaxID=1927788 RepID=UPI0020089E6F|nr:glycoside hydrolase family 72 protein [Annulohypoxylon maeteangense]KAI0884994.1 glycoside hydrolase family 72 protein [Annulohypoxylon maeteangense]